MPRPSHRWSRTIATERLTRSDVPEAQLLSSASAAAWLQYPSTERRQALWVLSRKQMSAELPLMRCAAERELNHGDAMAPRVVEPLQDLRQTNRLCFSIALAGIRPHSHPVRRQEKPSSLAFEEPDRAKPLAKLFWAHDCVHAWLAASIGAPQRSRVRTLSSEHRRLVLWPARHSETDLQRWYRTWNRDSSEQRATTSELRRMMKRTDAVAARPIWLFCLRRRIVLELNERQPVTAVIKPVYVLQRWDSPTSTSTPCGSYLSLPNLSSWRSQSSR